MPMNPDLMLHPSVAYFLWGVPTDDAPTRKQIVIEITEETDETCINTNEQQKQ